MWFGDVHLLIDYFDLDPSRRFINLHFFPMSCLIIISGLFYIVIVKKRKKKGGKKKGGCSGI